MSDSSDIEKILSEPDSVVLVEYELSQALIDQGARPNVYPRLSDKAMAQLEAMLVKERIDELENVWGLMENDITLWTDAEGLPIRVGERIASLKSKLKEK